MAEMKVSLRRLLATGEFGDLRSGMSGQEVRSLLGEPDGMGNTSRKYRRPNIYLYGTVEFWFQRQAPYGLYSVFWESGDKGAFRLPETCVVEDWDFTPALHFEQVEDYLNEQGYRFEYVDCWDDPRPPDLLLPSGVQITFDDEGRLFAVSASLRA
jgi:hypothetical protein